MRAGTLVSDLPRMGVASHVGVAIYTRVELDQSNNNTLCLLCVGGSLANKSSKHYLIVLYKSFKL